MAKLGGCAVILVTGSRKSFRMCSVESWAVHEVTGNSNGALAWQGQFTGSSHNHSQLPGTTTSHGQLTESWGTGTDPAGTTTKGKC